MVAYTHTLKITVFSIRVGSLGSMEARRRLSLPPWGDCTPSLNYYLQNRGGTPRAGEAEDEGGTAAAGDGPRAGKRLFIITLCSYAVFFQ